MIVQKPSIDLTRYLPNDIIHTDDELVVTELDLKLKLALDDLKPRMDDYHQYELRDLFNWNEIGNKFNYEDEKIWYLVSFRSIRRIDADEKELFKADRDAHEEAKNSGGILKYWFGDLNDKRECLAMCVWANSAWARLANGKPNHVKAMKLACRMYERYNLQRHLLVKRKNSLQLEIIEIK